jgi:sigma-B regulation protein RsbU (phosphoserine phosphatase)
MMAAMAEQEVQDLLEQERDGRMERQLALLARMSQEFASSLDIDDTLDNAIEQMLVYMNAEAASIFLLENDDTELVCRASAGPIDLNGLRLAADQGIVGQTVQDNHVHMVRDVSNDPNFTTQVDQQTGFTTRSILCAPLTVKDRQLGAIEVINKRSDDGLFASDDQHMLTALASSAALAIHNAAMAGALVEQERIQRELELAREIQANLLPAPPGDSFPVHGMNVPIREVSGDFFDYFMLDDGRIVFNLADVSGKGMNAALLMAKTSSLLHCLGKTVTEPGRLLSLVNNEVCENTTRGMFVTMIGGIYNPADHSVVLANAGHQPALLHHRNGESEWIQGSSPPLGIVPGIEIPETTLQLDGHALYLYTDGVTEAEQDDTMLGEEGFLALVEAHADKSATARLEAIMASLNRHGRLLHDDVTMLVVEPAVNALLDMTITADASQLKLLRDAVDSALASTVCPDRQREAIVIAINEAAMNIIQHAYAGQGGDIEVKILNNAGELVITLRDYAPAVDVSQIQPRALDDVRPGGLGTHFIRQLMDTVSYSVAEEGAGNRLEMRITINGT